MKRKALRVRSEGSIPPYVTEAESRKQHSDSPLCNSLNSVQPTLVTLLYVSVKGCTLVAQLGGAILLTVTSNIRRDGAYLEVGNVGNSRLIRRVGIVVSTQRAWAAINVSLNQGILRPPT